jgi:phage shock protein C
MLMTQRLCRSNTERMVAGVCGGLAAYFEIDPTIVRVVYAVATALTGFLPGILLYLVMALVMPPGSPGEEGQRVIAVPLGRTTLAGVILVVFGGLLLLGNFGLLAWWSWTRLWPLLLILVGAVLLMRGRA